MTRDRSHDRIVAGRNLVLRLRQGPSPHGVDFDACRAVLEARPGDEDSFHALCMLLEGALADAGTSIEDTMVLVPLLKDLACGRIRPEDLL